MSYHNNTDKSIYLNSYCYMYPLQTLEVESTRKYDLLANELLLIYTCKTRIILCIMI